MKGGILREPLLHFLLLGAVLFLLFGLWGNTPQPPGAPGAAPSTQILVSGEDVRQMTDLFRKTWQREPTEEEKNNLIEDFVRSEIFYREAIAIGLDRGDEVLKRRLRQKMEFVYEDIAAVRDPSDEDLRAFMSAHPERYAAEPRIAFRQVFISTSNKGRDADAFARELLARIASGTDPDSVGDASLLEPELPLSPLRVITQQFGEEFGKSLLGAAPGKWAGPVRSTFGLHLIFVRERVDGRPPEFGAVREIVRRDWMIEQQRTVKDAAYEKIRERYSVTIEDPGSRADSTGPSASVAN